MKSTSSSPQKDTQIADIKLFEILANCPRAIDSRFLQIKASHSHPAMNYEPFPISNLQSPISHLKSHIFHPAMNHDP